ncbi:colicin uptake protein TolQ [bacterium BMS3Abin05]|nr:colicin uptake protein TolQ [bacterium BMS3Abin05]GBE26329.1 colicin uptake protein TolQ [bacterium BMS3Bbin03]
MGELVQIFHAFKIGSPGWLFMWLLLVAAVFVVALAVERTYFIGIRSNMNADKFMKDIRQMVSKGQYKEAVQVCEKLKDKALPYVIGTGLRVLDSEGEVDFRTVQNAVDEGTLEIIPKLQQRTGWLATLGNVATLLGLMGTIYGLILAFSSVSAPGVDAAEKSRLLAAGISTAMNTTLVGLSIAIPAVLVYTYIHNKTMGIIDEIDEHTVKLINLITGNK